MNQLFGLQHRIRVGWLSPPGRRAKPSSTSEVWRSLFESVALQCNAMYP